MNKVGKEFEGFSKALMKFMTSESPYVGKVTPHIHRTNHKIICKSDTSINWTTEMNLVSELPKNEILGGIYCKLRLSTIFF